MLPAGKMWKEHMEEKFNSEMPPISKDEMRCQKCDFNARYKFVRCPECSET